MLTKSNFPLSFGFMLATISAAAAMSSTGHIRSSEELTTAVHVSSPQQATAPCTYRGGPKSEVMDMPLRRPRRRLQ